LTHTSHAVALCRASTSSFTIAPGKKDVDGRDKPAMTVEGGQGQRNLEGFDESEDRDGLAVIIDF
jgi:hypothetical protein